MDKGRNQVKSKRIGPYRKAEYLEFVRFTALPRVYRDQDFGFNTDEAFTKHRKLSSATIYEWKKSESFWSEVAKTKDRWGRSHTPDVLFALLRTILKEGRAAEVKLWLQFFENFSEKSDTTFDVQRETLKSIQDNTRTLILQEKTRESSQ